MRHEFVNVQSHFRRWLVSEQRRQSTGLDPRWLVLTLPLNRARLCYNWDLQSCALHSILDRAGDILSYPIDMRVPVSNRDSRYAAGLQLATCSGYPPLNTWSATGVCCGGHPLSSELPRRIIPNVHPSASCGQAKSGDSASEDKTRYGLIFDVTDPSERMVLFF